jgi:hypothetical protein
MVGLGLDLSVRLTSPQVDMTVPSFARSRRRLGFCLLFGLWAVVTAFTLERWDAVLSLPYMSAISYVSALLLNTIGVPVTLGSVPGSFAILSVDHVVFHVTRECTGVYALGLYIAAVLSYSAPQLSACRR